MRRLWSQPARRALRRGHRGSRSGQGLVEFALVAPLLIFVVFGTIDVGRLMYTYNAISSASREGARIVALGPQKISDCDPLRRMELVGQAFPLVQDPRSVYDPVNNTDPNQPSPPNDSNQNPSNVGPSRPNLIPPGEGYIYIYPAVAQNTSPSGCGAAAGITRPEPCPNCQVHNVAVQIEYSFQPLTPLIRNLFPNVIVRTVSVVQADY